VQFEKSPAGIPGPSPRFAEHTAEVMVELGIDPAQVSALVDNGTIVCRNY